jgi:hypothetical protein
MNSLIILLEAFKIITIYFIISIFSRVLHLKNNSVSKREDNIENILYYISNQYEIKIFLSQSNIIFFFILVLIQKYSNKILSFYF